MRGPNKNHEAAPTLAPASPLNGVPSMTTERTNTRAQAHEDTDANRFQSVVLELLGPVATTKHDIDGRAALLRSQCSGLIYAARLSASLGCSMSDLLQIAVHTAQERGPR